MEKFERKDIEDILSLTSTQEGMLFHYLENPQSQIYFEQLSLEISGGINPEFFKKAWNSVIETNEMLRTVFHWEKLEKPSQIILKEHPCKIKIHDLSDVDSRRRRATLEEIKEKDRREGFDLTRVPFRIILCKLDEIHYEMVISNHHIIYDGWSNGIILKEFFQAYQELFHGKQPINLPTKIPFKEFIKWNQNLDRNKQEHFWRDYLAGFETPTELPIKRKIEETTDSADYSIILEEDIKGKLDVFVKNNRVTMASVFYTAWGILLQKYCDSEDVIFGTPVSGRSCGIKGIEDMVGLFINTIPLRTQTGLSEKIIDVVFRTDQLLQEREEFESTPLPEIRSYSTVDGSGSLFDTIVVIENYPLDNRLLPENSLLSINSYSMVEMTHYDLSIGIMLFNEIELKFTYNRGFLEKEYIESLAGHFKGIIKEIIEIPEIKISRLEVISIEEKNRILYNFNNTVAEYPRDKMVHQLFEEQASKTPAHIALVGAGWAGLRTCPYPLSLSYRELNIQSDGLAGLLIEKGVLPDNIVGIIIERSLEMIIGIFGILKSGGAYLPIDSELPQERIDYMLKDSGAKLLVTTNDEEGEKVRRWEGGKVFLEEIFKSPKISSYPLSFLPSYLLKPSNLAYIIYTSGSTGRPKGVMINHGSVVNLLFAMQDQYPFTPANTYLLKTSYTFDVSVTELFGWYMGGGSLAILETNGEKDPYAILNWIHLHQVTHVNFVPSMFNVFLDFVTEKNKGRLRSLKYIFLAGEALLPVQVKKFLDLNTSIELKNIYGPTEGTVYSSQYPLFDCNKMSNIPIGKPLPNIELYILNKYNQLQPLGVAGELCITGVGLSRGYLNRLELTAEKFKKSFAGGFYKTGDLARLLFDGNIEFLRRIDQQVKIRGFRIEMGEIENLLLKYDRVKEGVVIVREKDAGDRILVAYFVSDIELSDTELRDYLSKDLPDYMIPAYFVQLEKIPLTPNGKIDRKALPSLQLDPGEEYSTPRNEIEKKMVEIWESVLGVANIGINDNFFAIGGDSIKIIQIASRMNTAGYKLDVKDIFKNSKISLLAPLVRKQQRLIDQTEVTGIVSLTPIQRWFFENTSVDRHHFNQAVMLYFRMGFDKEAIKKVFIKIHEHHDALRMVYKMNSKTGEVLQVNHGPDYPLSFREYDLKGHENSLEEINEKINEIQKDIDLEKGPLMKLGLFHLSDGDRLLIVIHHLVIDGISWRILFEDIGTLYARYIRGESSFLPLKSDSFALWSKKLQEYANSKKFLKEKNYWAQLETNTIPMIKTDFGATDNYVEDAHSVSFILGEEETTKLLTRVNAAFKTEINDILLTALALGINKTFNLERVLIALEGHGREEIMGDIDISRTIGWFTSLYPILLDISYANDPGRQIKEIKETLRRIPNKGIGYGILKYLTKEENKKEICFKLKPQISFNYMGQFDADVRQISFFEMAKESTGDWQSLNHEREYLLDVVGIMVNNRLTMTISFNNTHFKPQTMSRLIGNFQSELTSIIEFCCVKQNIEPTPGDFTYKGLSIENVDRLMKEYPGIEDFYTLTPMQEGMLFHAIADNSSHAYFEQLSFRFQGELNAYLAEKSLNKLFKRHDILRTAFAYKDIEPPLQLVLRDRCIDFYYEDISTLGKRDEKYNYIKEFKAKDKKRPFDLNKDTLMRVSILRVEEAEYEFIWSFHHILMDGWCIGILNAEFFEIYTSYQENRPHRLPGVKPYRMYIQWLEKQDKEESVRYWENYLDSYEEQTGIPRTKTRKLTKEENQTGYRNETISIVLDMEKTVGLNKLSAGNHVTLNTVTQTLWGILLGKYNGKEDVVFGAVVSGRPSELEGVESMVGLFINTIPVRVRFEEKMKFNRLLQQVQQEALAGESYHYHPLAEIQSGSILKQNLIDHILIFENYPIAEQIEGYRREKNKSSRFTLKITNVDVFEQTNYDFNVSLSGSDRLTIKFQYNGNVLDRDIVERIAKQFCLAVDQVIENQGVEVGELTLISEEEKSRLLYEFNNTAEEYPKDKTIHQLFEEQIERTPNYIAVFGHGRTRKNIDNHMPMAITYCELNEQSTRLAWLLIEKNVLPDTIVGIMEERTIEMIIGILGILKAGGAYLPIDPDYPQERIDYVLKDSAVKLLVTTGNLAKEGETVRRWEGEMCYIEDILRSSYPLTFLPSCLQNSSNLAYVIYTSGTTGRAKGVTVMHRGVVNYIYWRLAAYGFSEKDVTLQLLSYTFDGFGVNFYSSLLSGGKLVIVSGSKKLDFDYIKKLVKGSVVSNTSVTPGIYELLLNSSCSQHLENLRFVVLAGEKSNAALIMKSREKAPQVKLYNEYGPTETTITATANLQFDHSNTANIGKPIANANIYIIDKNENLTPIGIPGQLTISGNGLARGYLNNPELTSEKFIFSPFTTHHSSLTLYKTGDLCRWLLDGNIEFLGRLDHQVKIRGFRIELGEIENRLLKYKSIKEAAVIDRTTKSASSSLYLCAYIVPKASSEAGDLNIRVLREFLSRQLPEYMIPAYFVKLKKIPLNGNGKINRNALPDPEGHEGISLRDSVDYMPPSSAIEKKLVEIWEKVLGRKNIGILENFFLVGGDSIKSIQIISRMNSAGYKLEMRDIFQYPVISELAPHVKKLERIPGQSTITGTIPLTPIQKMFFAQSHTDPHHFNQAVMFYSKTKLDKEVVKKVFIKIQEHHDALRMTYKINLENGEAIQSNHGLDYPLSLDVYDLRNRENALEEFETKVNEIQAGVDLENGPLMKLGLFYLNDGDRLLIAVHHLVIDGVSWRILFEDIETLYGQYKRGEKLVLPPKTDSLKLWAEKLSTYANSKTFLKEKLYWQNIESVAAPLISKDFEVDDNYIKDTGSVSFTLEEEPTDLLLTKVNGTFRTEINDILLTALGTGIKKTFRQERLLIALEGHGREEILEGIDISRTVGWFTSLYPVALDIFYSDQLGRQIKEIKEILRRIPHKGIGYGILKYLTREENKKEIEFKLKPQISFNYLGQFDADAKQLASFENAKESIGDLMSLNNRREYLFDISGMISNNRLTMTISYNQTHFKPETIAAFIGNVESELHHIIEYCISKETTEYTPSDFTYKELSMETLEKLANQYSIEDIYILSPMQEGKLFYTFFNESPQVGKVHMSTRIAGNLNLSFFTRSINELFKRYDILRAIFLYEDVKIPIQIILKERQVDILYEDIRKIITNSNKQSIIEDLSEKSRKPPFDLRKDVLLRIIVLQTCDFEYEIMWTFHHILMDGWCIGILFSDFLEIYNSFEENRPLRLQEVQPFKTYIRWLMKQDNKEPEMYWEKYLDGYVKAIGLPKRKGFKSDQKGYRYEKTSIRLNNEKTTDLHSLARRSQVTLNTILQAIWGIILSKYNRSEDIIFGAVVSGRPPEISGIESMVGLFINTVPVRMSCDPGTTFQELLRRVQKKAIESERYHYYPLARIQAGNILQQNLLDHIMVFENYPLADQIEGIAGRIERKTLEVKNVSEYTQPDYNLHVVIQPYYSLIIEFRFNALVYTKDFMEKLGSQIEEVIDKISNNSDIQIEDIKISDGRLSAKRSDLSYYTEDFNF